MKQNTSERSYISKNLNFLRILQKETLGRKYVEQVRDELNISRSTADEIKRRLIEAEAITEKLTINPNFATFIGISISYNEIEISVVGLDGKVILWKDILPKMKKQFADFKGKISFNYSSAELIKYAAFINELLSEIIEILPVKSICISWDDVDEKNGTFSLTNYLKEYHASIYSFSDFCTTYLDKVPEEVEILLADNTMCQLVSEEFPLARREYNSLYIRMEANGSFAAFLLNNAVSHGYNGQTINLSGAISENDKKTLVLDSKSNNELLAIYAQIFRSLIIPITPERIYISGKMVPQDEKFLGFLSFHKSEILDSCIVRNYDPRIKLISNSMSKGAAIMAMYRYYGWNYTCV